MNWKITCEIFNDQNLNLQFEEYFRLISNLFEDIIPDDPVLGYVPIKLVNSDNGHTIYWPLRADLIKMGMNQNNEDIPDVCFKFAHLLCHVYIDPRVNNWFIESICTMMGLYIVQILGQGKTVLPEGVKSIDKDVFNDYYISKVRDTYQEIEIMQHQHSSNWLKNKVKEIKCIKDCGDPAINYMVAFELFPTFSGNPDLWESLQYFGKSTNPPPPVDSKDFSSSNTTCPDFELLKSLVPDKIKELTTEVIHRIWD